MPTVLVIDEIGFSRETICNMLKKGGYKTIQAGSRQEGLRLCEEYRPDLVLTDILMPDMAGLETIQTLRRVRPQLPIIAITASCDSPYLSLALKLGAVQGLLKPFKQAELLSTVGQYLRTNPERGSEPNS